MHTTEDVICRLIWASSILFFIRRRPPSNNYWCAEMCFNPSRKVFSGMYHFDSGCWNARWLIPLTQQSITRSDCLWPLPTLFIYWGISKMRSLARFSFHCVVTEPFSSQISMVSDAHCLTPTPEFSPNRLTWWVSILIVLVATMTDFYDDWFWQPESMSLHFRCSMVVVNDCMLDFKCLLL